MAMAEGRRSPEETRRPEFALARSATSIAGLASWENVAPKDKAMSSIEGGEAKEGPSWPGHRGRSLLTAV